MNEKDDISTKILQDFERLCKLSFSGEKQLKDVRVIIERIQEELRICKDSEEHLRVQLHQTHQRLLNTRTNEKRFAEILNEHRNQKLKADIVNNELVKLSKSINEQKTSITNKISLITEDLERMERVKQLQIIIKQKDDAYYLLQMNHETALNDKNGIIKQLKVNAAKIENDLQSVKLERDAIKNELEGRKIHFNQQKRHYEQVINQYETERSVLLGDFIENSPPKKFNQTEDEKEKELPLNSTSMYRREMLRDLSAEPKKTNFEPKRSTKEVTKRQPSNNTSFQPKLSMKNVYLKPLEINKAVKITKKPKMMRLYDAEDNNEDEL